MSFALGFAGLTLATFTGRKKRDLSEDETIVGEEIKSFFDFAMELDNGSYCLPKVFCEVNSQRFKKSQKPSMFQQDVLKLTSSV